MSQQEKKELAISILHRRFAEQRERLREIDPRLEAYFAGLCEHTSAVENDPDDWHNLYEVLGGVKFLRMLRTYDFNLRKVRKVLEMREGVWRQDVSGVWRYVSGGLKCPGSTGATVYRWKPFQVFMP